MTAFLHSELWVAIDALAKLAGLDPTSFNRSKRLSAAGQARPRWPSTESLAKVLEATGVRFLGFAALTEGALGPAQGGASRGVPLLGFALAGSDGIFDEAGFPVG